MADQVVGKLLLNLFVFFFNFFFLILLTAPLFGIKSHSYQPQKPLVTLVRPVLTLSCFPFFHKRFFGTNYRDQNNEQCYWNDQLFCWPALKKYYVILWVWTLKILLRKDLISFNTNTTNTDKCREIVTDKSPSLCLYKYTHINKYIEHLKNNNKHKRKTCMTNMHTQTVTKDFSRRREREPSILGTFVRLNVFDYKGAEQSDHKREVIERALS